MSSRYAALYAAYAASALLWLLLARIRPQWWPAPETHDRNPRVPLRHIAISTVAIILIGQAYGAGFLIPESSSWRVAARSANQILIFTPAAVALWWIARWGRANDGSTLTGVPTNQVPVRLAAGCACAIIAMLIYVTVFAGAAAPLTVLTRVLSVQNIPIAVQVLGEDVGILLALCAIAGRFSPRIAVLSVAVLFSAAHLPAMLQQGEPWRAALGLILDAGLVLVVATSVLRTRDIWIVWPVHSMLDAMQFYAAS